MYCHNTDIVHVCVKPITGPHTDHHAVLRVCLMVPRANKSCAEEVDHDGIEVAQLDAVVLPVRPP